MTNTTPDAPALGPDDLSDLGFLTSNLIGGEKGMEIAESISRMVIFWRAERGQLAMRLEKLGDATQALIQANPREQAAGSACSWIRTKELDRRRLIQLQEYHDHHDRNFEGQCEDCQEWHDPRTHILIHRADCEWLVLASAEGKSQVLASIIRE